LNCDATHMFWARPPEAFDPGSLGSKDARELSANLASCKCNSGLAGACVTSAEAMILADAYNDPLFNANIDLDPESNSLITAPIFRPVGAKRVCMGILQMSLSLLPTNREHTVRLVLDQLVPQIGVALGLAGDNVISPPSK